MSNILSQLKLRKPVYISKEANQNYIRKRLSEINSEFAQNCAVDAFRLSFDESQLDGIKFPVDTFVQYAEKYVKDKYAFLKSISKQIIKEREVSFSDFSWRILQAQGYYCLLIAARSYYVNNTGKDLCTETEGHGEIQEHVRSLSEVGNFFLTARALRLLSDYTIMVSSDDFKKINPQFMRHVHELFGIAPSENRAQSYFSKMGITI